MSTEQEGGGKWTHEKYFEELNLESGRGQPTMYDPASMAWLCLLCWYCETFVLFSARNQQTIALRFFVSLKTTNGLNVLYDIRKAYHFFAL